MSVKVMGLVWDLDIPSNEKFVLLAYTDHASHDGTGIYPSVALIQKKTGYSERSIQGITRKLQKMGLLVRDGRGPKGTNRWKVPLVGGAISAPLCMGANPAGAQTGQDGGANGSTERVQPTAPKPSEPSFSEPSVKERALRATQIPEVVLYRSVVNRWPPRPNYGDVIKAVQAVSTRLGRPATSDDLMHFFSAWTAKGWRENNIAWLTEWAASGIIPQNGNKKPTEPQGVTAAREWLEGKTHA